MQEFCDSSRTPHIGRSWPVSKCSYVWGLFILKLSSYLLDHKMHFGSSISKWWNYQCLFLPPQKDGLASEKILHYQITVSLSREMFWSHAKEFVISFGFTSSVFLFLNMSSL